MSVHAPKLIGRGVFSWAKAAPGKPKKTTWRSWNARQCSPPRLKAFTAPNPMVGCVVVQNGEVVGEGYHDNGPGHPHAEAEALRNAGDKARGATVYVTLEPCNHHGNTPPCARR